MGEDVSDRRFERYTTTKRDALEDGAFRRPSERGDEDGHGDGKEEAE